MSNGKQTFGDYLLQFSLAVDIVDDKTFDKLVSIIEDYVRNYLKIDNVSLKNKTMIDENVGLYTVSGHNKGKNFSVWKEGKITGQTAYAFIKKVALWVVDKNRKDLKDPESQHVDLWSGVEDLPQSKDHKRHDIKTSIMVPIIRENEVVGVVEFETMEYFEPTLTAKKELTRIANTISRVQYLNRTFLAQNKNTVVALKSIEKNLSEASWPELTKPQIFVAFSSRADQDVVGQIKSVLDSFSNRARLMFWDECNDSGKVDQQIIRAITKSKFGVCYFSEPDPGSVQEYIDNPNVIFEAGMFQSLTNSPREKPIGWVPIREEKSPPPPFDYGSDRILIIKRLNDHSLNQQAFGADLKRRISALLDKIEP